tara:strand:- start:10893 stop:12113 length:1221 start_codon:yes stop_codon:yes gene_type:complete
VIKVGINIGNSKISCIVSDYSISKKTRVLSLISHPTEEVKKNLFLNYQKLLDEIKILISESEKNSQTKIYSINLNIPTIDSLSEFYDSEILIGDEKITDLHLKKAINQSNYFEKNDEYFESINNIVSYEIDNKTVYYSPLGNYGDKLKINFYRLLLSRKYLKNIINLSQDLKINIDNYIPTPLSSALATLSNDEKKLGSICIDLGHSSTSTAIFFNNSFIFADSFMVGSNHVTNDIARGVSTTISSAERLKTLYGSVLSSPSDEHENIEIPNISGEENKFNQINRSKINSIIKPRIEETLEIVWQKIKQNGLNNKKIKNVVITGGGAQLEGIREYAEMIFSSNVRLAKPLDELNLDGRFANPAYSDVIGTILYNFEDYAISFMKNNEKKSKNSSFSSFFTWLDKYI